MISCRDKTENLIYITIPRISMMEIDITEMANMIVDCMPLGFALFKRPKNLFFTFCMLRSVL